MFERSFVARFVSSGDESSKKKIKMIVLMCVC